MDELQQEFKGWRSHGMAQLFFEAVALKRDMESEYVLGGGTLESQVSTAQKIGFIQGLRWVLETCVPESPVHENSDHERQS